MWLNSQIFFKRGSGFLKTHNADIDREGVLASDELLPEKRTGN